jgi:hypothetical protein
MTASEHLSPSQFTPEYTNLHKPGVQLPMFMTPHEIGGMMSADYGVNMRHVPERMHAEYEHARSRDEARGHTWGQSKPERIANQVRESGGIEKPVRVLHLESGVSSLYDGNHRAAAALEQNKLVPVDHFFDHHEVMHEINRDNGDVCWRCGVVPPKRGS